MKSVTEAMSSIPSIVLIGCKTNEHPRKPKHNGNWPSEAKHAYIVLARSSFKNFLDVRILINTCTKICFMKIESFTKTRGGEPAPLMYVLQNNLRFVNIDWVTRLCCMIAVVGFQHFFFVCLFVYVTSAWASPFI